MLMVFFEPREESHEAQAPGLPDGCFLLLLFFLSLFLFFFVFSIGHCMGAHSDKPINQSNQHQQTQPGLPRGSQEILENYALAVEAWKPKRWFSWAKWQFP